MRRVWTGCVSPHGFRAELDAESDTVSDLVGHSRLGITVLVSTYQSAALLAFCQPGNRCAQQSSRGCEGHCALRSARATIHRLHACCIFGVHCLVLPSSCHSATGRQLRADFDRTAHAETCASSQLTIQMRQTSRDKFLPRAIPRCCCSSGSESKNCTGG